MPITYVSRLNQNLIILFLILFQIGVLVSVSNPQSASVMSDPKLSVISFMV